jgi:peptidoglycan-associated lipoprotein
MMHLRFSYLLLLAAPLLVTSSLRAQALASTPTPGHQEVDLAVTYTVQHSNLVSNPTFFQQGGSVELSAQTYRGLGIAANITGTNVGNAANSGVGLTMVTTTFGPRYTWYRPGHGGGKKSLAIFGKALIGESHGFNSYFPTLSGSLTDYNSFALQVGGGVDIGLSRRFAIRVIQADWLRTQFPNSTTNVQNNLRLGAGVVLRWSH